MRRFDADRIMPGTIKVGPTPSYELVADPNPLECTGWAGDAGELLLFLHGPADPASVQEADMPKKTTASDPERGSMGWLYRQIGRLATENCRLDGIESVCGGCGRQWRDV